MDIKANPHPKYKGVYVTADGRVFQECFGALSSGGYHLVALRPNGPGKYVRVRRHTLVLEAFVGPTEGLVARHKDGNPGNDHIDNLQWGTQAENAKDTVAHGRSTKGSRNARALLNEAQVVEIRERLAQKESYRSVARDYGRSVACIVDIGMRRTWQHV